MRLGLSSEAAPDASVEELVAACTRRGLATFEFALGPAAEPELMLRQLAPARRATVPVSGLLSTAPAYAHHLSALSRRAAAPIIVGGAPDLPARITFARSIAAHGGNARVLVRGPAHGWLEAVLDAAPGFAWQIDDSCPDPAADADLIMRSGGRIDYIRLVGGGPEAALQDGRGIGALMKYLALAGYSGPLVLVPSSPRYHLIWATWLGRRGGWGCGSQTARGPRDLITIER